MQREEISYDDVRLVAAIAAAATMQRAQRALGGHVATLYRRLRDLERRVGGPLFERVGNDLVPTSRAAPFLEAESALRDQLAGVQRRVAARDDRLTGPLRITTADSLLTLSCECAHAFHVSNPGLRLSIEVDNAPADLSRRSADIAIRPTTSPPETLIGLKAGRFDYAVYQGTKSAAAPGWIAFEGEVGGIPTARWIDRHVADDEVRLRVNGLVPAAAAAATGWGKAILPAYLANEYDLERVEGPIAALESELWVLYHPDLRTNPRVRGFAQFAAAWLRKRIAPR